MGVCDFCHRGSASAGCARCKRALYCNRTCQRNDWKKYHGVICYPPVREDPCPFDESSVDLKLESEDIIDASDVPVLVEVRDHPVRGKGVYAKKRIPAGTLICFFGGTVRIGKSKVTNTIHSLRLEKDGILPSCIDPLTLKDTLVFGMWPQAWTGLKKLNHGTQQRDLVFFLSGRNEGIIVTCLKNNFFFSLFAERESLAIGQFIRYLKPEILIDDARPAAISEASRKIPSLSVNCLLLSDDIWIKTTRTVAKGEELVADPGFTNIHWADMIMKSKKPEFKLMIYDLMFPTNCKSFLYRHASSDCLKTFLNKTCGIPKEFLAKKDPKVILQALANKVYGDQDHCFQTNLLILK